VETVLSLKSFDVDGYFLFSTRQGIIKRTAIRDYANINAAGLIAINLVASDELVSVSISNGNADVVLATREGRSIRFEEGQVRETGLATQCVIGIRLRKDDYVVSLVVIPEEAKTEAELLTVSEAGFGKRTLLGEYPVQNRGGMGVITMKVTERTGSLVSLGQVTGEEELFVLSEGGVLIRTRVSEVSNYGRSSQGVTIMRLDEGDQAVATMVMLPDDKLEEALLELESEVGLQQGGTTN
jgi:DNA gyrase subunit A